MAHRNSRKKTIAKLVDTSVTLDILITKDLEILCKIYKLTPEKLLQKFSLSALYETRPDLRYKPTLLFMAAYMEELDCETNEALDKIFFESGL